MHHAHRMSGLVVVHYTGKATEYRSDAAAHVTTVLLGVKQGDTDRPLLFVRDWRGTDADTLVMRGVPVACNQERIIPFGRPHVRPPCFRVEGYENIRNC